uniref:Uncharacterized protein n=1 Tax=Chromera velia CCMP2878 TaxID=1169474 RepID=A0A0G4HY19_9ALVE|mmetsp:Transcript_314/g.749  ORF Transcript_314/g.749 Transcript_314/m.749 type:complete len:225 (+) Transcript_314:299-973(+)|eukprot:Cvel_1525.t1-p1 / transcript=Cvel_1525.t1 / gene=Cvel_1525 / organism=Chromera_velia_CCMP2878 / gene_product=hypothetical protein / transcript_product=hypothetical protein / location=Cvel_scaffold53:159257-160028(-) / protein_length=224 / sequence_SO=supercontig / SO=protein_coding / is_pseudo=false
MASTFFGIDFSDCTGLSRVCPQLFGGKKEQQPQAAEAPAPPLEFRTRQQVGILVDRWMTKLHPRAVAMSQDDIRAILDAVATCVSRWEDPLDPKPYRCCKWYGEQGEPTTYDSPTPIMKIALNQEQQRQQQQQQRQRQRQTSQEGGGGETSSTASTADEDDAQAQPPSSVFSVDVRRVLAFCFADDDVYNGIAQHTTKPAAECNSKLCISTAHFARQVPNRPPH